MRRTKEDAALTRETVLDAALAVFSRQGYAATTLDHIAQEAGVTRGAIYWHFGGKAELYNALVEERFARAFAGWPSCWPNLAHRCKLSAGCWFGRWH